MSVLAKHFNPKIDQSSPLKIDLVRRIKVDEKHVEHVVFEPFDYDKFQQSLGTVEDWSLQSLTKAGINPDFPIHTTSPTRLELEQQVEAAAKSANELFSSEQPEEVVIHEPEV